MAVAERLLSLCSAFSSSPSAHASRSLTCFWPALQAAQDALSKARGGASQPAEAADGSGNLEPVAALLGRMFAMLAVRQRSLRGDREQLLAALPFGSSNSATAARVHTDGATVSSGGVNTAAGFRGDVERVLATMALMRTELRLAELSRDQLVQQQGGRAGTDAASRWSAEAQTVGSIVAMTTAEDARTLLDDRAAAALMQLLIEEPEPLAAGDAAAQTLWLTLHGAIAHLRLQGVTPACSFLLSRGPMPPVRGNPHSPVMSTASPMRLHEVL